MPCSPSTLKKYTSRNSPAYPAQDCKNKVLSGNDGNNYISVPNKNNVYRWQPIKDSTTKKSPPKRKSPASKRIASKSPKRKSSKSIASKSPKRKSPSAKSPAHKVASSPSTKPDSYIRFRLVLQDDFKHGVHIRPDLLPIARAAFRNYINHFLQFYKIKASVSFVKDIVSVKYAKKQKMAEYLVSECDDIDEDGNYPVKYKNEEYLLESYNVKTGKL